LPNIFTPYAMGDYLLKTRVIHASIADGLIEKEYSSPETRFALMAKNGISFFIVAIKTRFCGLYGSDTIRKLKKIVKTVHREGGFAVFKINPFMEAGESSNPWICAARRAGFDGIEVNLRGKYLRHFIWGVLNKNIDNDRKYIEKQFQLIKLQAGFSIPIVYKMLIPITRKGIHFLGSIGRFLYNNQQLLPAAFHISMGMKKKETPEKIDPFGAEYRGIMKDYFHAVKK